MRTEAAHSSYKTAPSDEGHAIRKATVSFEEKSPRSLYRKKNKNSTMNKKKTDKPVLPEFAPEKWPGKCHTQEDVTDFFRRVWKQYIPYGLTLTYLKQKDLRLHNAIYNYPVTEKRSWPNDLKIPTRRTRLAETLQRLEKRGPQAVTPEQLLAVARKLIRQKKQHSPTP